MPFEIRCVKYKVSLKIDLHSYFEQSKLSKCACFNGVGAIMPTPTIPTATIPTKFLPANNANGSNPDFNIDSNNVEK